MIKKIFKKLSPYLDVGNSIFSTYGLLIALLIATDVPLKPGLIIGLSPLLILILVWVMLLIFKFNYTNWRLIYKEKSENKTNTIIIKNILLPILLCLLFLYMRGEYSRTHLFTISSIQSDMIVHTCGSSINRNEDTIWDAADLVSQPSENEVFIITNAVFGFNQSQGYCPQTGAYCSTMDLKPGQIYPQWVGNSSWAFSHSLAKSVVWRPVQCTTPINDNETETDGSCDSNIIYDNGIGTGECDMTSNLCTIRGWCDPISMENFSKEALFLGTNEFTIFLDMHISFPEFSGPSWTSSNDLYEASYSEIYSRYYGYSRSVITCLYDTELDPYCPRFLLQDVVTLSGQDFFDIASLGGRFKINVNWECNFDWGKDIYDCLPEFSFQNRALNNEKPKIFSQVTNHEDERRTVTYNLGIGISIAHSGRGLQIQLFNLILAAQFIYVSYKMLQDPLLIIVLCIQAFLLNCCGGYSKPPKTQVVVNNS